MAPEPAPDTDLAALRAEAAHLRRVNQELLATVAELRATIETQQAHIDRLVRMTFGRRSEKGTGANLSDEVPELNPSPALETLSTTNPPPEAATPRQRHGRRPLPADLPRERVEIDLTDAEKACPHCQRTRIRIGAEVSERLDYRPAALFARQ